MVGLSYLLEVMFLEKIIPGRGEGGREAVIGGNFGMDRIFRLLHKIPIPRIDFKFLFGEVGQLLDLGSTNGPMVSPQGLLWCWSTGLCIGLRLCVVVSIAVVVV